MSADLPALMAGSLVGLTVGVALGAWFGPWALSMVGLALVFAGVWVLVALVAAVVQWARRSLGLVALWRM